MEFVMSLVLMQQPVFLPPFRHHKWQPLEVFSIRFNYSNSVEYFHFYYLWDLRVRTLRRMKKKDSGKYSCSWNKKIAYRLHFSFYRETVFLRTISCTILCHVTRVAFILVRESCKMLLTTNFSKRAAFNMWKYNENYWHRNENILYSGR